MKADQLGGIFVHDMRSLGVDVRLVPARRRKQRSSEVGEDPSEAAAGDDE